MSEAQAQQLLQQMQMLENMFAELSQKENFNDLWRGKKELQDLIFLLTLVIPIIIVIHTNSASYDGWRHLYFIYPSFLLIAMLGFHLIKITFFKKKNNYLHIFLIILIIPTAFWMYKNHPFQYVYFNFLAGKNFNEKFEMDYYGVSNKNALEYIIGRENKKIKISIPPTLLISSIGIIKSYKELLTITPQNTNDFVYVIGRTGNEMGGSEFAKVFGLKNFNVPTVYKESAKENYNNFIKANRDKLISSAISVGIGGLAVALSKMSIASQKGLKINFSNINTINNNETDDNHILFSESQSRIVVTVNSSKKNKFESYFKKNQLSLIGRVIKNKKIFFTTTSKDQFEIGIDLLNNKYKRDLFNK